MTRDFEFEKFVSTNLGDVAVWDAWKQEYISPKIRLYLLVWNKAKTTPPTDIKVVLSGFDTNNYYDSGSGIFSISRHGNLRAICQNFNHHNYEFRS